MTATPFRHQPILREQGSWRPGRRSRPVLRPGLELLEDRCLPAVSLLSGIDGLDFAGTGDGAPPDTIAAAGPAHLVEAVNTDLAIYSKAGAKLFQQDLGQFFAPVMTGNALSDPVVAYDELAGRFVVGVLDLSVSLFGTISSDRFLFAVSDSSDPTADTNGDGRAFTEMHSINMTENVAAGQVFADFPRFGWNADGYYVTFNMFTTGFFNAYDHAAVVSIDKASALDGNNATFTFTHHDMPGGTAHATLAPAAMHGSAASTPGSPQPMYFVEEVLDANGNATGTTVRLVRATDLLTANPTLQFTDLAVAAYRQPPSATQQGSSALISTNDSRFLNAEWRNNRLVATHTVGVTTDSQAHARWYEFDTAATPALVQQGTLGLGSGSNSYYPAIALNANGELGMSYIQSSSAEYLSMYVTGRVASDPLGTMEAPVLAKAGQAPYSASFDSSPYRAGDYSGITVDPVDGTFWAANEYAKTSSGASANWGTHLANFALSSPTPAHDVAVTAVNASPNPALQGAAVTVTVTVANQGSFGETFDVAVAESPGGANLGTQTVTLTPGEVRNLTFTWTTDAGTALGSHTLTATASIVAGETDTADNTGSTTVTVTAPVHDVAVTAVSASPNPAVQGNTVTVTVTVANQGTFGETFNVAVAESPGGASLGTQTVTLAAGEVRNLTFTWTTSAATATGSHTLTATATAVPGETDTADNTGSTTVTVNPPTGSPNDIYVWDMAWSVTARGSWITVSVTVFIKRDSDGDGVAEASDAPASGAVMTFVLNHYVSGFLWGSTTFTNAKTNGNGQVTFNLKTQVGGDFHAQVTALSKSGLTWRPALDHENPSCYAGAPGGGEVPCSGLFTVTPGGTQTSGRVEVGFGELPPVFHNPSRSGGPRAVPPAVAFFRSPSPLLNSEEGNLDVAAPQPGRASTLDLAAAAADEVFVEWGDAWLAGAAAKARRRW